jgi:hypothetical protein
LKIQNDGDALISGTYHACQPAAAASPVVPCSAIDAVAVLPLPVGGSCAPTALHVSIVVDYPSQRDLPILESLMTKMMQ